VQSKWNSVLPIPRWTELGVFDALLESLAELVERERSADMVDSTMSEPITVLWA
jgi:hypothetical protein